MLAELAALGRRFTDRFGPVSGRLQVWLFANATEASDTVRTLLGSPLDADRQAAFVQDPVGGGDGIVVVVPRSGDASLAQQIENGGYDPILKELDLEAAIPEGATAS